MTSPTKKRNHSISRPCQDNKFITPPRSVVSNTNDYSIMMNKQIENRKHKNRHGRCDLAVLPSVTDRIAPPPLLPRLTGSKRKTTDTADMDETDFEVSLIAATRSRSFLRPRNNDYFDKTSTGMSSMTSPFSSFVSFPNVSRSMSSLSVSEISSSSSSSSSESRSCDTCPFRGTTFSSRSRSPDSLYANPDVSNRTRSPDSLHSYETMSTFSSVYNSASTMSQGRSRTTQNEEGRNIATSPYYFMPIVDDDDDDDPEMSKN